MSTAVDVPGCIHDTVTLPSRAATMVPGLQMMSAFAQHAHAYNALHPRLGMRHHICCCPKGMQTAELQIEPHRQVLQLFQKLVDPQKF